MTTTGPVTLAVADGMAVVTIQNPPVNALSAAVRAGLLDAVRRAAADPGVKGVVIAAKGKTFIAGADITEFGKPPAPPSLPEVIDAFDAVAKPIVAAIGGAALGGGLEVALGCHARVAAPAAKLGLPEVKLGLLPGAGGTQRLPRLIGAAQALLPVAHRRDRRLLQHDLGQPDAIGVHRGRSGGGAPGQVARVAVIPGEQQGRDRGRRGG